MGYYSDFEIELTPKYRNGTTFDTLKRELELQSGYELYTGGGLIHASEIKWYGWEEECAAVAKRLSVAFIVTRRTEDHRDQKVEFLPTGEQGRIWSPGWELAKTEISHPVSEKYSANVYKLHQAWLKANGPFAGVAEKMEYETGFLHWCEENGIEIDMDWIIES